MFSVIVCSGLSSKLECFRRLMPSRAGRGSNAYACSCIFSFYSSQSLPHVAFNCVMLPNSAELSWFFWLFSFIAFKYLRVLTNSFFPNLSFPFLQWNIYVLLLLSLCILLFGLICWLPFHFLFSKFLLKIFIFGCSGSSFWCRLSLVASGRSYTWLWCSDCSFLWLLSLRSAG